MDLLHALGRLVRALRRRWRGPHGEPTCVEQARDLIDAVDRGGIPLNPMRVNHIARGLGLDVSARAPVSETIERIRAALKSAH